MRLPHHLGGGQLLRLLVLSREEEAAHLGQRLQRLRIGAVQRIAVPERVLVELQALVGHPAEDHRPQAAVADRQRLVPDLRRAPEPDDVPPFRRRRRLVRIRAHRGAVAPPLADQRARAGGRGVEGAVRVGVDRRAPGAGSPRIGRHPSPRGPASPADGRCGRGGSWESRSSPPVPALQGLLQAARSRIDHGEAVAPGLERVGGVRALQRHRQRVAAREVARGGEPQAGDDAGADRGGNRQSGARAALRLVEVLVVERAVERRVDCCAEPSESSRVAGMLGSPAAVAFRERAGSSGSSRLAAGESARNKGTAQKIAPQSSETRRRDGKAASVQRLALASYPKERAGVCVCFRLFCIRNPVGAGPGWGKGFSIPFAAFG